MKMVCGSQHVDEDDKLYTKKFLHTKKLLLLGTGESGKTTIIKQMKILHINGFTQEEKKEKIPFIKQNIHESIYEIISNMETIQPPERIGEESSRKSIEFILKLGPTAPEYTSTYFHHVKSAWADSGVQRTFRRSNEYQLIDCAEYFFNRIDDICKEEYVPTVQDILFCRTMTVAISKIEFEVPVPKKYGGGIAEFCVYDVGGQRGQRKKWIQVFDGILGILFLISASDFDQTMREDGKTNRLKESFNVFKDIIRSKFLRDAGLIVFLNKQDILERKINQGRKLKKYFPEFCHYKSNDKECKSEYDRARLFMKQKIIDIAEEPIMYEHIGFAPGKNLEEKLPPRQTFIHFTIATDTNNIKKVFNSVHEIILDMNITTALY